MLNILAVSGYRSLRDLCIPLELGVVVVSHAPDLIDALRQLPICHAIALEKRFGATAICGHDQLAVPWQWPAR